MNWNCSHSDIIYTVCTYYLITILASGFDTSFTWRLLTGPSRIYEHTIWLYHRLRNICLSVKLVCDKHNCFVGGWRGWWFNIAKIHKLLDWLSRRAFWKASRWHYYKPTLCISIEDRLLKKPTWCGCQDRFCS